MTLDWCSHAAKFLVYGYLDLTLTLFIHKITTVASLIRNIRRLYFKRQHILQNELNFKVCNDPTESLANNYVVR